MPRVWNPFDATRATSACGETFLPELRHGSYRRASFLQRLRNKNGMMYNSYFKERRNHGLFCTNCGTNVPDGIKFCTSCGTPMSVQAQPQPRHRPSNLCAAATCASATTAAGLCPAIATGLRTTSTGIRGSGGAIRTLRFPREASMNRSRRVGISVSSC